MEFTAEMIAGFLGGTIVGDKDAKVWTVAKIEEGRNGALSFLSNPKYEHYIYDSDSSIIIINNDFVPEKAVKATLIKVENAYASFAKLLELYTANKPQKEGVSPQASISTSAKMGEGCYVGEFAVISDGATVGNSCKIYPQVYVGDRVTLGDNVTLHPGVKIYEECVIGNNVTIHSGSVIGADGFGWAPNDRGEYDKIPQIGNVVIEDNVDIGANTCVDRATMGSTVIGRGVKLDNFIQIAHNVTVGENTVMAAFCGVAGSTKVGANCTFAGDVGLSGHLTIGDRVLIGPQSGVSKSIPDGETWMGYPAIPAKKFHRVNAVWRNLPDMSTKLSALEKEVKRLAAELEEARK